MNKAKYFLLLALLACGRNNKTCLPFEPLIPESEMVATGEAGAVIEAVEQVEEILIIEAGSGAITFQ